VKKSKNLILFELANKLFLNNTSKSYFYKDEVDNYLKFIDDILFHQLADLEFQFFPSQIEKKKT
jgi:hypothetical protein